MQACFKPVFLFLIASFLPVPILLGQGIERFSLQDFDLSGPVKQCDVLTAYGKEEFHFNKDGLLTKVVTRFNENDQDITHYRYEAGQLSVKRDEVYRDGAFDRSTSMAHFYTRDTLRKDSVVRTVLKERILSYDKDLNELNEYYYDREGRLTKSVRVTEGGIDEIQVAYERKGDTLLTHHYQNELISAMRREYPVISESGDTLLYKQNTEYLSEMPAARTLEIYDSRGNLKEKRSWKYNPEKEVFNRVETFKYSYNDQGVLQKEVHSTGKQVRKKEYVYQFDNDNTGNWVKQIILPDNAYVTRRITYYPKSNLPARKSLPEE